MSEELISVGGTAVLQLVNRIENYVGASVGELDGAVWARATSEPRDKGNGQLEFTMIHEFVTTDGSTLSTDDLAVATPIPGSDEVRMYVLHTIVASTGKFTDKRGTFPSFGIHNQKTGRGVQRFL